MPNLQLTPDELLALHQALGEYLESGQKEEEDGRRELYRKLHDRVHNVLVWACSIPDRQQ